MDMFFAVLKLVCGLSFFLFSMRVMSGGLEKMAGGKLERSLRKVSSNPFVSVGLGAIITIAMQSSSATTVMLVGLVNSGILEFAKTLNIIFGANIGTTLTSWILSLSGVQSDNIFVQMLKPVNFSPILAIIGVLMIMLSKSDSKKSIGNIFIGFTILIYGMEFMKDAVTPIAETPYFAELLLKFQNPLLGVLIGTVFTAIIQGSAPAIGILQALAMSGAGITYGMALPVIMGINIGTCATSLISCIGANTNAKRVAVVHTSIKAIGTVICLTLFEVADAIFNFAFTDMSVNAFTVALLHTVFNIAITIILMPFTKQLVRLTEFLVKEPKKPVGSAASILPVTLDDRLLRSPGAAAVECDSYTRAMCRLSYKTLLAAIGNISDYDEQTAATVLNNEEIIDAYEDTLGTYLVKVAAQPLSSNDSNKVSRMLHTIGDFERLGDHAVNLIKVSNEIRDKKIVFSQDAIRELAVLRSATEEILSLTSDAYCKNDLDIAAKVEPLEQVIDKLISTIKSNHVTRLQHGKCTIELGFVLGDLLTNYERISDHCSNVAVAVIEAEHNSFDTHKYLNGVKYGNNEFNEIYDVFDAKYVCDKISV